MGKSCKETCEKWERGWGYSLPIKFKTTQCPLVEYIAEASWIYKTWQSGNRKGVLRNVGGWMGYY